MRTVGLRAFATAAPKRKGQKEEAAPAVTAPHAEETATEKPEEVTEPPETEDVPEEPGDSAEPERQAGTAKPAPKRKGQKAAGDAA